MKGWICQAYLAKEFAQFTSFYFPDADEDVARSDGGEDRNMSQTLTIFRKMEGIPCGKSTRRDLTDPELRAAHLHVLLNCAEVNPFYE